MTSDPDIYAIGDAVEISDYVTGFKTMTPLAGPANKQARIAADNVFGRKSIFKGTLGTAVVKIFNLVVACTGTGEKFLLKNNISYLVSYTHSGSHASYYPGSEMMAIKLIFSPENGKLLGAQIAGGCEVDKRIDIFATAIRGDMSVYDLEELELSYAPPFSSAKDPVNVAGFVAANILKGDIENIYPNEVDLFDSENEVLIDLRGNDEVKEYGMIKGSLHIPVNDLREKITGLDKSKKYILYCAVGLRGYIGYRIMIQNGFNVRNLSGGYKSYSELNHQ
jgi:rhodanese-related sulfurtransferase